MIFQHEDIELDSTISSKAKLYKAGRLLFIGDGYKAITMMLNIAQDKEPVKAKFHAQLTLREKPKFSPMDDIDKIRREALEEQHALDLKNKKVKKR
jgi:hypothetical protein